MFLNENITVGRKNNKLSRSACILKMALGGHIISVQTLANWEKKRFYPDVRDLEALCLALNVPMSFFFDNKHIIS